MTREEAIKGLKVLRKDFSGYKPNEEMFDMAIEALEQEPTAEYSSDVISRQETLKGYQSVCKDIACHECRAKDADGTCRLESFINNLPSADRARMESDGE